MSLAIVGKVGASIAFLGTSSIVGCVLIKPELFGIYSDVYMYAISTTVSDGATEVIKHEPKNFQCKFAESDAFDCEVFKLKTKTEKHYEIDDIHKSLDEDGNPGNEELKTSNSVFKIKFSGKHWDQTKHIDKNIEIISTSEENKSKKYADLKTLFAKHNGKVIGKTNYFVAKAGENTTVDGATTNTFKCSFDNKPDSKIDCTITEFTNSETGHNAESVYKSLTFAKPTSSGTTLTEIIQHKHYLIQFTGDNNKHEIEGFKHKKIHLSVVDATPTPTQKTEFKNVKPSFYDDKYDGLFIV